MVELIMGCLVLALATFAIFDGLEGAQTGHMNKERLGLLDTRPAGTRTAARVPITSLSNYRQTRTVNIAGIVTASSRAQTRWSTRAACSSSTTNAAPPST